MRLGGSTSQVDSNLEMSKGIDTTSRNSQYAFGCFITTVGISSAKPPRIKTTFTGGSWLSTTSVASAIKTPRVTMPKMENRALGEVAGPTLISGNLDTKRVIPLVATLLRLAGFNQLGCTFKH